VKRSGVGQDRVRKRSRWSAEKDDDGDTITSQPRSCYFMGRFGRGARNFESTRQNNGENFCTHSYVVAFMQNDENWRDNYTQPQCGSSINLASEALGP
jgi:hypothetical protein